MEPKSNNILSRDDYQHILLSAFHGGKSLSEDQLMKIIRWAELTQINSALLEKVMKGELYPGVDKNGEVTFQKI